MEKLNYTPGPWRASILDRTVTTSPKGILEGSKRIADCINPCKSDDEVIANTILIAAAPQMYEALLKSRKVLVVSKLSDKEVITELNKILFEMDIQS